MLRVALLLMLSWGLVNADDIAVRGIVGKEAVANGRYKRHGEAHGYPCYKNQDFRGVEGIFLCLDAHGFWSIQPESEVKKQSANVLLHSSHLYKSSPEGAGPWLEWRDNKTDGTGSWMPNFGVSVTRMIDPRKPLVRKAILLTIWGSLFCGFLAVMCMTSHDKWVRSSTYLLLSSVMTVTMAYCATLGLEELLFVRWMPAATPGVTIILNFVLFTLGYSFVNFAGWKCQYSEKRLALIGTLGAHIVAFIGIYTASAIQKELVLVAAPQFQGPLLKTLRAAQIFTAILSVALVSATFAFFRWASQGARRERFFLPPVFPWGAKRTSHVPAESPQRSCTPMMTTFSSAPPPPVSQPPTTPDWHTETDQAEDEAESIVVAFLINQALIFYSTGDLPAFAAAGTPYRSQEQIVFWFRAIAVLVALSLLLFVIRCLVLKGSRVGTLVQKTLTMSVSWCVYRLVRWQIKRHFGNDAPCASLGASLAVFATAVVLMFILVKLAQAAKSAVSKHAAGIPGHTAEQTAASTLGLLAGVSVAEVLLQATGYLIEETDFLQRDAVLSQILFIILITTLLFRGWYTTVLPKALMGADAHQEGIAKELDHLSKV